MMLNEILPPKSRAVFLVHRIAPAGETRREGPVECIALLHVLRCLLVGPLLLRPLGILLLRMGSRAAEDTALSLIHI